MSGNSPWSYGPKWETCHNCKLTAPDVAAREGSGGVPICPTSLRCAKVLAGESLSSDNKWGKADEEKGTEAIP